MPEPKCCRDWRPRRLLTGCRSAGTPGASWTGPDQRLRPQCQQIRVQLSSDRRLRHRWHFHCCSSSPRPAWSGELSGSPAWKRLRQRSRHPSSRDLHACSKPHLEMIINGPASFTKQKPKKGQSHLYPRTLIYRVAKSNASSVTAIMHFWNLPQPTKRFLNYVAFPHW